MTDKPRKLTIKQKKFVKEYVKNDGNGVQAALAAYDTKDYDTAKAIAVENLTKPSIAESINNALEKHGITIEVATQPIADGLKANDEIVVDGVVVAERPNHNVRLKASGMALKLLGADKEDKGGNTYIFSNNSTFNSGKYIK